ncbi:MAG: metal-sensing transcriptional repressor [Candidatus Bathyarchaeia archaeon]
MNSTHRRRKEVLDRLSRIEGHIRGIRNMVEEDRACSELLIQIAAVRAALNKIGQIILDDHMETCIVDAMREGKHEKALSELKEALSQYLR